MSPESTSPPTGLVGLRWLFTAFAILGAYQAVQMRPGAEALFQPTFDVLYHFVVVPLTWGACAFAWLNRWRAFVSLGIMSRAIGAFGALYYAAGMVLSRYSEATQHLDILAWNLGVIGLAIGIIVYLVRRFPPKIETRPVGAPRPMEWRLLTSGFVVASVMGWLDVGPSLCANVQAGDVYGSEWTISKTLIVALFSCACACAWRARWQAFVSVGFIGQTLAAFVNLRTLTIVLGSPDWRESAYHVARVAKHLSLFAFAIFTLVYFARRFPPELRVSQPAPT